MKHTFQPALLQAGYPQKGMMNRSLLTIMMVLCLSGFGGLSYADELGK